jgi:GH18 family chitinase
MQELSNALHSRGKYLSAAVVASGGTGGGVKNEVFGYVDMLNIMAYDGSDTNHSPYSYAVSSLDYWINRGLPREKVVLGVPYYARPSWQDYRLKVAANAANACRDTDGSDFWNGVPTIRQKAVLARNRAGGIMTWELSQDTNTGNSLLTAMHEANNGLPATFNCN